MLHTGKKPATYDRRDIRWADVRPKQAAGPLPTPPPGWGRASDFVDWKGFGNMPDDDGSIPHDWAAREGAGDCTIADAFHAIMQALHDAGLRTAGLTARMAIELYALLSEQENPGHGYDPRTGANDNGLMIRTVLRHRQRVGITDAEGQVHKIGPYISIEPGDWRSLREALWLTQSLSVGVVLTEAQIDQFNANQVWSHVRGAPDVGGHDWPIMGHPGGGLWAGPTWARRQVGTYELLVKQADEIWAYLDPDRYETVTGLTYNGYASADLERYFAVLAAGKTAAPTRA